MPSTTAWADASTDDAGSREVGGEHVVATGRPGERGGGVAQGGLGRLVADPGRDDGAALARQDQRLADGSAEAPLGERGAVQRHPGRDLAGGGHGEPEGAADVGAGRGDPDGQLLEPGAGRDRVERHDRAPYVGQMTGMSRTATTNHASVVARPSFQ